MCRFIVYKGAEPIQLSHLVTRPRHSIINQAFESKLRFPSSRPMNADGFGIGWYDPLPPPVPFHQTQHHSSNSPIPSDPNGVPAFAPITPIQSASTPVDDEALDRQRSTFSSSSARQRSNLAHPNSTDIHPDKWMDAEQEGSVQPSPPGSPAPFSPTNRGTQKLPADGTNDGDEAEEQVEEQAAAEPGVVMEQHVMLSNADQREEEKKQNDLRRVRAEERVVENERPCVFKSISPAWSNANLTRLAEKIRSGLIFAHVRASTMPGAPSEDNCHPWIYGKLMWMHNGELSNFTKIKRKLQQSLPEELFLYPSGYTDSEWVFMVFLSKLKDPKARTFTHQELRDAMMQTLRFVNELSKEAGITSPHLLNYVVTDGETVVAIRYISSRTSEASSLFFSSGTSFDEYQDGGLYRMTRADKRENIVMIASEPLTFERSDWMEVKTNTMLVVTPKMNILQIPIVDEYWVAQGDKDAHKRSTDYAVEMGFGHGFASMKHGQEVTVA